MYNPSHHANVFMAVLSMNEALKTQLKILKLSDIKPNFSELARFYDLDRRTVKKYYDGYEGKTAHRNKPSKDYSGILVTDSLQQYHLIEKKLPNVTNANCWAHARRSFADAVKIADKKDPKTVKQSVAYQALQKIGEFYTIDTELKMLSSQERLQKRQELIKPLVEEFFPWVKEQIEQCSVPPKSKTGEGLRFIINQEKYLRVFLDDGDVPIDNSASERAIRTFCLGKKNWMFHNTANGATASALVYSISETAKLNNLRPYYYFKYILTELPNFCDEQRNIDSTKLDDLMPWSDKLPEECRKPRR